MNTGGVSDATGFGRLREGMRMEVYDSDGAFVGVEVDCRTGYSFALARSGGKRQKWKARRCHCAN